MTDYANSSNIACRDCDEVVNTADPDCSCTERRENEWHCHECGDDYVDDTPYPNARREDYGFCFEHMDDIAHVVDTARDYALENRELKRRIEELESRVWYKEALLQEVRIGLITLCEHAGGTDGKTDGN